MTENLNPNSNKAWTYLQWLMSGAVLHVERMDSTGPAKPITKTYGPNDGAAFKKFLDTNNGPEWRRNCYFMGNSEHLVGKRNKENTKAASFLHIDLDCKDFAGTEDEALDHILALLLEEKVRPRGVPKPSFVWFTGGGFQALWKLAEPLDPEAAEELNKGLIQVLGGDDGTHNVDRLLRMPFSVNWLNDKKRDSGREPKYGSGMDPIDLSKPPASYNPADFKLPKAKASSGMTASANSQSEEIPDFELQILPDDLSLVLPDDGVWLNAIKSGEGPPSKQYKSRSELVFAVACWMASNEVEPGFAASVLLEPNFGISAHVLEASEPVRYAIRQVKRAILAIRARRADWPELTEKGAPVKGSAKNIRFGVFRLGVTVRRNEFTGITTIEGAGLEDRDLGDAADILSSQFEVLWGFIASSTKVRRELIAVAHENGFNPVLAYLDQLVWDGTPRLGNWLSKYCGVPDSDIFAAFAAKTLIAAVRRVRIPGCKFDTMLVLEGAQGKGKSSLIAALSVNEEWFSDSLDLELDDKSKSEILRLVWIAECQEMNGLNKATDQKLKKFLSSRTDVYRPSYGREAVRHPRHSVIIGTTNEARYLRDQTGNRRYWPVVVEFIDLDGFKEVVSQLWAEANEREAAGESIELPEELWGVAEMEQRQRMIEDPYEDILLTAFTDRLGRVSMETVKRLLGLTTSRIKPFEMQRVKYAMTQAGWQYQSVRLHAQGRQDRVTQKGFVSEVDPRNDTEWVLKTENEGDLVLVTLEASKEQKESPF